MPLARIAALALWLVAACRSSPADRTNAEPTPAPEPPAQPKARPKAAPVTATSQTDGMELTFTLAAEPGKLIVDYRLRNTGDAKVWVADQLLQNTPEGRVMKVAGRLIVRNGDAPDVVSLVRGMTYESMTTGRERPPPSPAMKPVEPGEVLEGRAEVPLPLAAWHNYGRVEPLAGDKKRAVLELTYIEDPPDPKVWWQVPLEDGRKVPAPEPKYLKKAARRITSEPLPLPLPR